MAEELKKVNIRLPEPLIRRIHFAALDACLTKEQAHRVGMEQWVTWRESIRKRRTNGKRKGAA